MITIHTPKTEETINMIGKEELKKCKKGVRLVNCARGGLYNEQAVADAIKEGQVASIGLDVLVDEPKPISPLIGLEQCVLTPHLGADTVEAQDKVGISIAQEVVNVLNGQMVPNAVNLPALHPQELEGMMGYLQLGECLGKLYYQMEKDPVDKVEVVYEGPAANLETTLITRSILKGLFDPILKERVNMVNAELAAETRGVAVVEGKMNGEERMNRVSVKISSGNKTFTAAGMVAPDETPHITEVQGYHYDLVPEHYMILAKNDDKPGMIGQMGTLLGAAHVNIANMQVARKPKTGNAMMIMTVDSPVEKATLQMIAGLDGIQSADFVTL